MSDRERSRRDHGPDRVGGGRQLSERAQQLTRRAAATDRRARFHLRLAAVREQEARLARRRAVLERVVAGVILIAATLAGAVIAGLSGTPVALGVTAGAAGGVVLAAARSAARRYAIRRGARAWDWRSRRHVLHGDPSRQVQAMSGLADDPATSRRR